MIDESSISRSTSELRRNYSVVGAVFFCLMFSIGSVVLYSYGVFAPELVRDLGWNRAQVAGGILAHNLGIIIGAPLAGYLSDKYGTRYLILLSIIVFGALWSTLAGLTSNIWYFYLVLASVPIIAGGALPIAYTKIVVSWFDKQRGLALGMALAGVGIGATVIPPLSQHLIETIGWRKAYVSIAFLAVAIPLPLAAFFLSERNDQSSWGREIIKRLKLLSPVKEPIKGSVQRHSGTVITSLFYKQRSFQVMAFFFFLSGVALTSAIVNFVPILVDKGTSPSTAALIASVMGITVVLGRIIIGYLLDRLPAAPLIAVVCLGPTLAFLILSLGSGSIVAILAAAFMGFAVGAEVDLMAYLVSRYFTPNLFGRLYGLMFSAFVVGGAIGPLLVGLLRDATGSYNTSLLVMSGVMLCAAILILALPKNSISRSD